MAFLLQELDEAMFAMLLVMRQLLRALPANAVAVDLQRQAERSE